MLNRRVFLHATISLALSTPFVAGAQPARKHVRIGTLDTGTGPARRPLWDAFDGGLRELGYVEGRNVVFERRWAEGNERRLPVLAAELVKLDVDVIVAAGTLAALEAVRATTSIPVVFVIVASDPVTIGLVSSFARPGANATGGTSISADLSAKRLSLLKEAMPEIQRVAVLWDQTSRAAQLAVQELAAAARSLGLEVEAFGVRRARDLDSTFSALKGARAEGVVVVSGGMFFTERHRLAELSLHFKLPTAFSALEYAEAGGLLAYGADLKHGFRRGAIYVDRILQGTKPGDLPVERPDRFELVINLRSAKALGWTIPPSLLLRADRLIE